VVRHRPASGPKAGSASHEGWTSEAAPEDVKKLRLLTRRFAISGGGKLPRHKVQAKLAHSKGAPWSAVACCAAKLASPSSPVS
jgi:hypothetical protein